MMKTFTIKLLQNKSLHRSSNNQPRVLVFNSPLLKDHLTTLMEIRSITESNVNHVVGNLPQIGSINTKTHARSQIQNKGKHLILLNKG